MEVVVVGVVLLFFTFVIEGQDISLFTMLCGKTLKVSIRAVRSHCKKVNWACLLSMLLCEIFSSLTLFEENKNWKNKSPWFSYMSNILHGRWMGKRPLPLREVALKKSHMGDTTAAKNKPGSVDRLPTEINFQFSVFFKISLLFHTIVICQYFESGLLQMTMTIHLTQETIRGPRK